MECESGRSRSGNNFQGSSVSSICVRERRELLAEGFGETVETFN
jgi:hypothetical protein